MSDALWGRRSDADVLDAAARIDDYNDLGQSIIVEELRRRGLPVPEHLASITAPAPERTPDAGENSDVPVQAEPGITFFSVTTEKFVVMSVCSFGLYSFYWFFENWRSLARERARETGATPDLWFSPILRALFAPIWAFMLFRDVRAAAEKAGVEVRWVPWLLAAGYMLGNILYRLPEQASALGLMSLAFLVPVQRTMAQVNEQRGEDPRANARYSLANLACIAAGTLILLGLVASFFVTQPTL